MPTPLLAPKVEIAVYESTITSKGRTTVPRQVREHIGAAASKRVVWHVLPTGALTVLRKGSELPGVVGATIPSKRLA